MELNQILVRVVLVLHLGICCAAGWVNVFIFNGRISQSGRVGYAVGGTVFGLLALLIVVDTFTNAIVTGVRPWIGKMHGTPGEWQAVLFGLLLFGGIGLALLIFDSRPLTKRIIYSLWFMWFGIDYLVIVLATPARN